MWGRFFAFAMLILIILAIVQFSTLSDSDVEKIRAQIEAQQKVKQKVKQVDDAASPSEKLSTENNNSSNKNLRIEDSLLSEPSIVAYEAFLDAIPLMTALSEIDRYYVPSVLDKYKQQLSDFSNDPLTGFKNLHNLQAMEYMKIQHIGGELAMIIIIASNATTRMLTGDKQKALSVCQILMKKENSQWLVQDETWIPQGHPAFEPYRTLLDNYHQKRQGL